MPSFDRAALLLDRATIDLLSRRLAILLETDADPALLAQYLGDLVRAVRDFLHVTASIIDCLAREAPAGIRAKEIERFKNDLDQLKFSWAEYLVVWTEGRIVGDGQGFSRAAREMLPFLRERAALENALLGLLGLRDGWRASSSPVPRSWSILG